MLSSGVINKNHFQIANGISMLYNVYWTTMAAFSLPQYDVLSNKMTVR